MRRVKRTNGTFAYRVRYYEGGRGSPYRQATFERREDALRFETEVRRRQQLGADLYAEATQSRQTLEDFCAEWWEKHAQVVLRPGTRQSYAYVLDKWILPYLGRLRLRELSRESIDSFRQALVAAGAGAPTVNRTLAILQGILQRAVEWRRITANPVLGVQRLLHVRDAAIDARTPDLVEAIRARLPRQDAAIVSVLAYEGLRPAEAFALLWSDLLEGGRPRERLRVQRALSGHELSTTKSRRGRQPELFGPVASELAQLFLARGRPPLDELVFPDSEGGFLRRHNWRQRVWKEALEREPPIPYFRPYDLRHTCATLLIYEGRTVTEVAAHLGHADAGFTLRVYGHVFNEAERRRVPIAEAILASRSLVASAAAG